MREDMTAAWKMRRMERVGKVMLWARLVSQQRDEMNCYFFFGGGGKSFSKARPVWILDGGVLFYFFIFFIYIYIPYYKNYEINRCQLFFFFQI